MSISFDIPSPPTPSTDSKGRQYYDTWKLQSYSIEAAKSIADSVNSALTALDTDLFNAAIWSPYPVSYVIKPPTYELGEAVAFSGNAAEAAETIKDIVKPWDEVSKDPTTGALRLKKGTPVDFSEAVSPIKPDSVPDITYTQPRLAKPNDAPNKALLPDDDDYSDLAVDSFDEFQVSSPKAPSINVDGVGAVQLKPVAFPSTTPTVSPVELADITYLAIPEFSVRPLEYVDMPSSMVTDNLFQWQQEEYQSALLTQLIAKLADDLANGGYGIDTTDETALWEREKEREYLAAAAAMEMINADFAARGFMMPPGAANFARAGVAQIQSAQLSHASRDIALKRADMYVQNRQFAMQQSRELENMMITYFGYQQERSLKAAQLYTEMSIRAYNALAETFNIRVNAYKTELEAYNVRLQAALAPYERDKMMLELAKTKASVNEMELRAYESSIRAAVTTLEYNKGLLDQERFKLDTARTKLDVYRAEVDGFKAQIDAYQSYVQSKSTVAGVLQSRIQAFQADVSRYETELDANKTEWEAGIKSDELPLRKADIEWGAYKTELEAWRTHIQGLGTLSENQISTYVADLKAKTDEVNAYLEAARRFNETASLKFEHEKLQHSATESERKMNTDIHLSTLQPTLNARINELRLMQETMSRFANMAGSLSVEMAQRGA